MRSNDTSEFANRSSWQWWLAGLVAAVGFAFGAIGLWQYELQGGSRPNAVSVVYHTLQLFILESPQLERATPWQLHVGRLLAAGLFFAAAGKALMRVFRDELLLLRLWLPWRRGHVVVCGLDDLGLRLALDGRRRNRFVVAIDRNVTAGVLERARANGVLVLEGDARDPAQLRQTRVERAEFVVAVGPDDQSNVAIAAIAGQFAEPGGGRAAPLVCRLLIRDPKLRALVSDESIFPRTGSNYRVNFSDLDLEDTAARQAFRRYPLDFKPIHENDDTVVHLVVIGFGQIGQSLALHAARIGHFANEVGGKSKRLRITVVNPDQRVWDAFNSSYEKLKEVCEFKSHTASDDAFIGDIVALCPAAGARDALITYAVCIEEDEQAKLRLGLELSKAIADRPAQVLVHQTSRYGFASLFSTEERGPGQSTRVHAFGMMEDVFTWSVLLRESEDKLARAIHENYQANRADEGVPDKDNPGWDDLTDGLKDSNRQAADHIPVKLRALGYHDRPWAESKQRIKRFEDHEVLLLARMEHERWRAERWLAGWSHGTTRDPANKISDSLVDWDKLPPDRQKRDREQISAIPEVLARIQRGIYR